MKISIPKESKSGETRVAGSPEVVQKLVALGIDVTVQKGAGEKANFTDESFKNAGAFIAKDFAAATKDAEVIFKILGPTKEELGKIGKGCILMASLSAMTQPSEILLLAKSGITALAMELMPRITRAQSMDILSSQSNLAGYRAVIDGAYEFGRAFPMMMTAAGTIAPAKVFVMGVGVAGLQAIATAKRLGAVVTATDVRPATREQVESLGGKFLIVDPEMEKNSQTEGGYAKEMPPEYFRKQNGVVAEHIKNQDLVITTALIPGHPAPRLISKEMVLSMAPGSVIVDLAVESGGNCECSILGEIANVEGVKIVGYGNMAGRLPENASALFAKNLYNFLSPHLDGETKNFSIDWEDETVVGALVTRDGKIINQSVKKVSNPAKSSTISKKGKMVRGGRKSDNVTSKIITKGN